MKKLLIPVFVLAFVCGAALAEGGADPKGHDCPMAGAAKAEGMKDHDCPPAGAAKAEGMKSYDCPHAAAEKTEAAKKHDCAGAKAHGAKKHDCAGGHADKGKKCGGLCPSRLKGVEKAMKNVENGVEITFTAKDGETIARLQETVPAHYASKEGAGGDCPCGVEGAEKKLTNTETGVTVLITGGTPEIVKKIQDASAKKQAAGGRGCGGNDKAQEKKAAKKAAGYVCPMKCASSDKPGKCPECGMELVEEK